MGSVAVDAIFEFQKNPVSITNVFPQIQKCGFALMTFHPVTLIKEPIPELMNICIKEIIDNGYDVIVTYPNNDEGHEDIIKIIEKWADHKNLFVSKSLGAQRYYSALHDCAFVIGNSSSALIEAPYFRKTVLNVGTRQHGRDKDVGVREVSADPVSVEKEVSEGFQQGWHACECNCLYGNGDSVEKRREAILRSFT